MAGNSKRRRVMIVGTDGMRPDLLDPELMPTFGKLAAQGTRLSDYHAVFPTHTGVNLTTLATGCTPGKHGFVANVFWHGAATEDGIVSTADFNHISCLDDVTGQRAIKVPTIGDLIHEQGGRVAMSVSSSAGRGMVWNRNHADRAINSNTDYGRPNLRELREQVGGIPEGNTPPRLAHLDFNARAVTELFLDDEEIEVIVLWFVEPDSSLHLYGIGSPETRTALKKCDDALKHVLDAMEQKGIRDQFDIICVSDHGHSSVRAHTTLTEYIERAKFSGLELPRLIVASDYIYADPTDRQPTPAEVRRLIEWLQDQPWCGVILAAHDYLLNIPGVLSLESIWGRLNERVPLLGVLPKWDDEPNEYGYPGTVEALTENAAKRSSHGSASPYEIHASAIFNGPSFRSGVVSEIPAGGIDILPTILALRGDDHPAWLDGRALWEVFDRPEGEPGPVSHRYAEPIQARNDHVQPRLRFHHVGENWYLDRSEHERVPN